MRQVELWAAAPHLCLDTITAQRLDQIARELRVRNLQVCCLTPEQCVYPVNLAAEEEELRQYSIRNFQRAVQVAQVLGCPKVLVTAGCGYFNRSVEAAWARSVDSLTQIAQFARLHGVYLVLETLTPLSSNLVNTPSQQRQMIAQLPQGLVRAMVDLGQMVFMGQALEDYLALGAQLDHVHLHDSHPAIHMALGDGDLPLADYLTRLEEWGYQGMYALECNDPRYRQNPALADRRNIAWLEANKFLSSRS